MLEERDALVQFHAPDRNAGGQPLTARHSESDARVGDSRGGAALSSAPASPSKENGETGLSPAKTGLFSRAASRAASFWRKSSVATDERQTTPSGSSSSVEPQRQQVAAAQQQALQPQQYARQPQMQQTQMMQLQYARQMPAQQHFGQTPLQMLRQPNQTPAMNVSRQNTPQALQGSPHLPRTQPWGNNHAVQPSRPMAFPGRPIPAQRMMRSP